MTKDKYVLHITFFGSDIETIRGPFETLKEAQQEGSTIAREGYWNGWILTLPNEIRGILIGII